MASSLSVTEVVRHFTDYINRVAYRRESFVLLRGGRPVAELRPLPEGGRLGDLPGLLDAAPRLTDADEFAADVEAGRTQAGAAPWGDPWES